MFNKLIDFSQYEQQTQILEKQLNRSVSVSCTNHVSVGLAPCAATHTYIAAIHIKETTSNIKYNKNKLG